MSEKVRYSKEDLAEFKALLDKKLEGSRGEFTHLMASIKGTANGSDGNFNRIRTLEDGADVLEKEQLNQLAARTKKYIKQLEDALVRLQNGTYGVCVDTGKLISKDRLKAVPHTQHSIEAKLNKVR